MRTTLRVLVRPRPVAGHDLDQAAALTQAALLGQPRREQQHPADEGQRQDQPDDHPGHAVGTELGGVADDLADPQAEVLVDDDDLAAGDEGAVDQQVGRRAGGPVELDHLAGVSESSSCTVMRVRPISTVTSMATCRSRSRLPP